jgi:hypothetical protein
MWPRSTRPQCRTPRAYPAMTPAAQSASGTWCGTRGCRPVNNKKQREEETRERVGIDTSRHGRGRAHARMSFPHRHVYTIRKKGKKIKRCAWRPNALRLTERTRSDVRAHALGDERLADVCSGVVCGRAIETHEVVEVSASCLHCEPTTCTSPLTQQLTWGRGCVRAGDDEVVRRIHHGPLSVVVVGLQVELGGSGDGVSPKIMSTPWRNRRCLPQQTASSCVTQQYAPSRSREHLLACCCLRTISTCHPGYTAWRGLCLVRDNTRQ